MSMEFIREYDTYGSLCVVTLAKPYQLQMLERGVWVDAYGNEIPLVEISDTYLQNINKFVRQRNMVGRVQILALLKKEINRRADEDGQISRCDGTRPKIASAENFWQD